MLKANVDMNWVCLLLCALEWYIHLNEIAERRLVQRKRILGRVLTETMSLSVCACCICECVCI